MHIDGEIKQQKNLLNDLNDIGQIKYKLPFSKPLKTLEDLDNWKPNDELTILPIQSLRKIHRTT